MHSFTALGLTDYGRSLIKNHLAFFEALMNCEISLTNYGAIAYTQNSIALDDLSIMIGEDNITSYDTMSYPLVK